MFKNSQYIVKLYKRKVDDKMNLDEQKVIATNQVIVTDSLEAPLLSLRIKRTTSTTMPAVNNLIVYVDTQPKTNPTSNRKQFVFELASMLGLVDSVSDEFVLEVGIKENDLKPLVYVKRNVNGTEVLTTPLIEELEESLIDLFEGTNYIYTNYTDELIEIIYPKDDELNKRYLNNAIFCHHRQNNSSDFSLDDIYFKDAFTKNEDKLNLEVDNINIIFIISKNNKFSLDEDGNLVVNSITTNQASQTPIESLAICNLIYPIGSIYMSTSSVNPSNLFGGTWEQLKDRFLLGTGDVYGSDVTGGESEHTLTIDEIPSHKPEILLDTNDGTVYGSAMKWNVASNCRYYAGDAFLTIGGNQSHNNMPPYLTVYMWKRTA